MSRNALLIGNSDGIGLALTKKLLRNDWLVHGISRSPSPLTDSTYIHTTMNVLDKDFQSKLERILKDSGPMNLCIYCAGIGELINLADMTAELKVLEVNFLAMVKTAAVIIPEMFERNSGHFIGISSVADALLSAEAPSYHASKAGFSNYLESLALALKGTNVNISNIRFGFVDTKMAKGDRKPFMISTDRAAEHIFRCINKKTVRSTVPKVVIPLVKFRDMMLRLSNW